MLRIFLRPVLFCMLFVFSASAETKNAILISLDGAQRAHLYELLGAGKLPAIKELKANGALVEIRIEGHQTETGPGHAEMLTGLSKEINNVVTNGNYKAIPEGFTICERLEKAEGKNNIITVMVMGKEGYMGAKKSSQPYFNAKNNIDVWDGDETRLVEVVGPKALGYLEQYKDKRLIYVTADHGFNEGSKNHNKSPEIFLAANDKTVINNGTQADIVPTILSQFNVDLSKLEPHLSGKPLNR